ncbi:MAG: FHA domain-containing protein [Planctomycetaceae bacterium]|nr:FHA domain-containing protein [Planctomycetaceae bacterium]
MATLWVFSPDQQQKLELGDAPVTIGRVEGNSVCVDEPTVSKSHARIVKDGAGWRVEDLGSSNGTWLDGARINSARLVAGGRIKIGSTEFVLNDIQIEDDSQFKFEDHGSIMTSVPAIPPGLFDEVGNIRESLLGDQAEIKQIAERGGKETIEVQKLRLIGALGEAVIDIADRSAVAHEILNTINREVRADHGFVCIFQEDGTFLPLASYGVKPDEPVRFSRTVIDKMRKEKAGVLVRQTDAEVADIASLKAMNIRSTACVPLWARNRIMGFSSLDIIDSSRSFTRRHLDLLIAISHHAALGLERARLAETAERERKRRDYLAQYLDHKLLQRLTLAADGTDPLAPHEQAVTVLFCDIVSFTKISEGLSPTDLAAFVRDHMTAMTEVLFAFEGTVDKYIGDAVMALFGAPVQSEAAPANAVRAALAMRNHVGQIDGRPVRLCFGIATGSAVVGNIGSAQRMEYTALGDSVNVASRLEGFSRPGEIVIDETTQATLGDGFRVEEIGEIDVRNRDQPVRVYRVLEEI